VNPVKFFPVFLLFLPSFAWATYGQPGTGGFSMLASFLQMGFALMVVIGLIFATYYIANRIMKTMPAFKPGAQHIRIVEVRPMGPRKSLILIEISGEYLLLSSSDNNISFLKQINMLEEIEVLDEPSGRRSFLSFLNRETTTGS
jgi:flagellar protein FliO/FliZ